MDYDFDSFTLVFREWDFIKRPCLKKQNKSILDVKDLEYVALKMNSSHLFVNGSGTTFLFTNEKKLVKHFMLIYRFIIWFYCR